MQYIHRALYIPYALTGVNQDVNTSGNYNQECLIHKATSYSFIGLTMKKILLFFSLKKITFLSRLFSWLFCTTLHATVLQNPN